MGVGTRGLSPNPEIVSSEPKLNYDDCASCPLIQFFLQQEEKHPNTMATSQRFWGDTSDEERDRRGHTREENQQRAADKQERDEHHLQEEIDDLNLQVAAIEDRQERRRLRRNRRRERMRFLRLEQQEERWARHQACTFRQLQPVQMCGVFVPPAPVVHDAATQTDCQQQLFLAWMVVAEPYWEAAELTYRVDRSPLTWDQMADLGWLPHHDLGPLNLPVMVPPGFWKPRAVSSDGYDSDIESIDLALYEAADELDRAPRANMDDIETDTEDAAGELDSLKSFVSETEMGSPEQREDPERNSDSDASGGRDMNIHSPVF